MNHERFFPCVFSKETSPAQPLRSISSTGSSKGAPLLPLVFLEPLRSHTNEGVCSSQFMRTRHFHFFRLLLFNGFHHFYTWTQMKLTFRPGEKSSLLVSFESSRKRNTDRNQKQTKMEKDFFLKCWCSFCFFFWWFLYGLNRTLNEPWKVFPLRFF